MAVKLMIYSDNQLRDLLSLSQKGDKQAYQNFLFYICPLVESRVQKKVFNSNDIYDVTQEILLSIHKSLQSYDSKRDVLPWVIAISERRIIDYIRKVTLRACREFLTIDGDVTFLKAETKVIIESRDFLEYLPTQTRKAIELTKIEGYSTKEAAELLGLKENALRTKISRGIASLRKRAELGLIKNE